MLFVVFSVYFQNFDLWKGNIRKWRTSGEMAFYIIETNPCAESVISVKSVSSSKGNVGWRARCNGGNIFQVSECELDSEKNPVWFG